MAHADTTSQALVESAPAAAADAPSAAAPVLFSGAGLTRPSTEVRARFTAGTEAQTHLLARYDEIVAGAIAITAGGTRGRHHTAAGK